MKNVMKKITACLLMAVMVLSVLGNGAEASAASLTAKQYLSKMQSATKKLKSYEITQTSTTSYSAMGQTMTTKQTTKQTIFQNPVKVKSVSISKVGNQSSKSVIYMKEESDGKIYMYSSTDGSEYEKTDVTDIYAAGSELNVQQYSSAKIVKKSVKVNNINTVQIAAKVTGDDMAKMMEALGLDEETTEALNLDFTKFKPIKATIYVDKKTYRPVKTVLDAKDFYNSMMESMGSGSYLTYTTGKITTTYKNYNKAADFSLPESCK